MVRYIADVVALAGLVGSVIVMCRPDRTNAGNLASCIAYLSDTGVDVLGVVVNDANAAGIDTIQPDSEERRFRRCPRGEDQIAFDETRQFTDED